VLTRSLVPVQRFEATATPGGVVSVDGLLARMSAPASPGQSGTIEYLDLNRFAVVGRTQTVEYPVADATGPVAQIGQLTLPFKRPLAALSDRSALIGLSTSGFMTLPLNFNPVPAPQITEITNAADSSVTEISPGGLIRITGANFSPTLELNEDRFASDNLSGVCVSADNRTVPLVRVSPTEIQAQMPWSADRKTTAIKVMTAGGTADASAVSVVTAAPGIVQSFGPAGEPAVFHRQTGTLVTQANPIQPGEEVTILGTGFGPVSPGVETGRVAPADPLSGVANPIDVRLGTTALDVVFAGLMPGQIGVYQVIAKVPATFEQSDQLSLSMGTGDAQSTARVPVTAP
jgi:uncharacterized protein (TIGR03437 family)